MGALYGATGQLRHRPAAARRWSRWPPRPTPGWSCAAKPGRSERRTPVTHSHHHAQRLHAAPRRGRHRGAAADPPLPAAGRGVRRPAHAAPDRRPRRRHLLPGPLEPRQGRPLHARRQLHRLVLVEGLRQGRDHHLGGPADRLPVGRAGPARVRAPRLPPRRRVLLVHLLAHPRALPLRPRARCCRCTARRRRGTATRWRRGPTIVDEPREGAASTSRSAGKGGLVRASWEEATEMVAAAHVHTIKTYGPDRVAGFSPIPAMSMVSATPPAPGSCRSSAGPMLSFYDWYADLPVAQPAGVRRPDRRARVRRLVGRLLPDPLGLERPGHPHARTRTG